MRRIYPALLVLWLIAAAHPGIARSQSTYIVGPWAGSYLPTTDLLSGQNLEQPESGLPATISFGQEAGFAWGIRGGRTLTSRLALEGEFFYSRSNVALTGVRPGIDQISSTRDASVAALSANVLFEIFRAPFTPFAIHVLGGVGVVSRSGQFFDDGGGFLGELDSGIDPALVVGGGFRYGLSPMIGLRLDVRDYISSYGLSLEGQELDSQLQNDILISGGVEFGF